MKFLLISPVFVSPVMAANPKSASQRALVGFLMVGATKVRAACSTTINVDLTKDTLPISQKVVLGFSVRKHDFTSFFFFAFYACFSFR